VSWGSVAGVCREARELAEAEGLKVKLLMPYLLYPVVEEIYRDFFASVRGGLIVEQSHQGQLYRILRMFIDVPAGMQSFSRSGSTPFLPSEVVARLREATLTLQRRHEHALQPQE
jgi:2-oxoglutarate ferredoxin oxidoreductase subunit alpha